MIKVLIVDDHEMVRMGLRAALEAEDDFQVGAEAESGEEALNILASGSFDLVLMDVMMEGMGGVSACRQIKESTEAPKVLMLTSSSNQQAVLASLMAGADGYLLKTVARSELLRCLRATLAGQTILDPALNQEVIAKLQDIASSGSKVSLSSSQTDNLDELSEREFEVVALISQGKTNKEIAQKLFIAEKTARNHVSRILSKLGLTRRSQAAAWAIRAGFTGA